MKHLSNAKHFPIFFRSSPLCAASPSPGCANPGVRLASPAGALILFWVFNILSFVLCPDAWAVTDADLTEEFTKGEKFITGGYMRLGLLAGCGIAGIIAMFKQSVMGLIIAASGALFVFLMKGWIGANFAAII